MMQFINHLKHANWHSASISGCGSRMDGSGTSSGVYCWSLVTSWGRCHWISGSTSENKIWSGGDCRIWGCSRKIMMTRLKHAQI